MTRIRLASGSCCTNPLRRPERCREGTLLLPAASPPNAYAGEAIRPHGSSNANRPCGPRRQHVRDRDNRVEMFTGMGLEGLRSAPSVSCSPRARAHAYVPPKPATTSPPGRPTSRGSSATASPTLRSRPVSSSALARPNTTSTRCSTNWASPPATNSRGLCRQSRARRWPLGPLVPNPPVRLVNPG